MLLTWRPRSPGRARQAGLSIVEMMVGVTIGLFVVAGATLLVAGQLSSNRLLVVDTQIQQDLRATADIIARELRRAGAVQDALARRTLWYPDMVVSPAVNPAATVMEPIDAASSQALFLYQREPAVGAYGFRLNGTRIQSRLSGSWQDLTDDNVLRVTNFSITPQNSPAVVVPCPHDCPGGGQACWPLARQRHYVVAIDAQAANDPSIVRSIRATVRVRADLVRRQAGITAGICPPVP